MKSGITKRNVLNFPRLKEIKRKKQAVSRKKILFSLVIFVLILIGLSFLSRWGKININEVKINGNKVVDTEMIKTVVNENLAGRYLWIFPKTNFLIYPKNSIKNELAQKFKRLKDISLNVNTIKTLEINLTERSPSFTWCGLLPPEQNTNDQKCYFMDQDGYIFDEAPYFSGEVYFKFYGTVNNVDLSTDVNSPSGHYFSKENFGKLVSFKDILEGMGLKPAALYIVGDGDAKILLSSKGAFSIGPAIEFKADADLNKIAENLQTALATEPFQTELKNKYSSLLYIDLRFGNKVYYKFQ